MLAHHLKDHLFPQARFGLAITGRRIVVRASKARWYQVIPAIPPHTPLAPTSEPPALVTQSSPGTIMDASTWARKARAILRCPRKRLVMCGLRCLITLVGSMQIPETT